MCNAWNHPLDCRCGWGGDGHLGRSSGGYGVDGAALSSYAVWVQEKYRSESEGYTNPNARCPVCQVSVYFYQSPDGGRVFFDELGPPWPKHPCTDNEAHRAPAQAVGHSYSAPASTLASPTRFAWQEEEWAPFICDSFAVVPPGACAAIGGIFNAAHVVLFILEKSFVVRAPYQLKRRDDSTYLLSTVQYQGGAFKVFKLIAYRHLRDALAAGKQVRRPQPGKQPSSPKAKSEPRRAMPRSMQKPPNQPPPRPKEAPTKTALQLAFERAKGAQGESSPGEFHP